MAPRPTKRALEDASSDDGNDAPLQTSQHSNGSDDQGLEITIAKYCASARERKKKGNEKKFLEAGHKQLSKEIAIPAEELKTAVIALEAIYADYLQKYAASEDAIHKLWSQIHREQQKLAALTQKKVIVNTQAATKAEAGHLSGLSRSKAACRELENIVNQILPED